jgi:trimethylamine---corrinoid protein Co-methyltransferase
MPEHTFGEGEAGRVLAAALRVLQQVGCDVHDQRARTILADHGATLAGERVRLPENTIRGALAHAPARVRLADRRGGSIELGGTASYLSTGSDGQFLLDAAGGPPRSGTLEDLVALTRVADALPGIAAVNLQLIPSELGGSLAQLKAMAAVLANSRKHHLTVPLNYELAKAWVDMLAIAEPGLSLAATPALSGVAVTTSPLVLDHDNCLKLLFFAEQNMPILTMPCPMAGASSPLTLAGTLVQSCAEALLQLTLVQSYCPGSPVIFGGAQTIMDMATGTVTYAAPEFSLLCQGMVRIARSLHLPSYVPLAHPDAVCLDEQCAAEKAFSLMNLMGAGANLFGGAGSLGKTTIVSCEQLVIDNELSLWAERYFRGMEVSDATLAEGVISQIGPGGDYFAAEHTLRYLRSGEHWHPAVSNRRMLDAGATIMLEVARDCVRAILRDADSLLPAERLAALDQFAEERGRALDRHL